jgi:hypothetical protein
MDAVEEPVNWSAIASQAFENKLAEITKQRGAKNMTDVISRLRVSKKNSENKQLKAGYAAGQEWAKRNAEAEQLERLESFYPSDQWNYGHYGVAQKVAIVILGNEDEEDDQKAARDIRSFWDQQIGEDEPEDDVIRGFAEGALSIWKDVKDQI